MDLSLIFLPDQRKDVLISCVLSFSRVGSYKSVSTSVFLAPQSHACDLVGHGACPPSDKADPVVPEGLVVGPPPFEPSGVHQLQRGSGSPVVDSGCQFVSGETFHASTTHSHYGCLSHNVADPMEWVWTGRWCGTCLRCGTCCRETCLCWPAISISPSGTVRLITWRLLLWRCLVTTMERAVSVCFSPIPTFTQYIGGDTGGRCRGGDSLSPHMAKEVLLHPSASDGMQDSMSPATQHGSPVTVDAGEGYTLLFRPEDPQASSMDAEWQTLECDGLSEDIIGTALACTRPSSQQVYDGWWQAFVGWSDEQDFNPIHATVSQVLDFLQGKSKSLQLNTVLGYVSNRHAPVQGQPLSVDGTMRKWVSGLKHTKGVTNSVPVLCLDLVLAALKRQPFEH